MAQLKPCFYFSVNNNKFPTFLRNHKFAENDFAKLISHQY